MSGNKGRLDRLPHRLYPEIVYHLNDTLLRWWKHVLQTGRHSGGSSQVPYFTTSFFSSHTRTFHWISIAPGLWRVESSDSQLALRELMEALRPWRDDARSMQTEALSGVPREIAVSPADAREEERRGAAWKGLLQDLPVDHFFSAAKRNIEVAFENQAPIYDEQVHRAALALYSGYHHPAITNVEGVFVRLLELVGHGRSEPGASPLKWLLGQIEVTETKTADWFRVDDSVYASFPQIRESFPVYQNVRDPERSRSEHTSESLETYPTRAQELIEVFFSKLLGQRTEPREGQTYHELIASRKSIAILPIYEVWHGAEGYGRIRGVLLHLFTTDSLRDRWLLSQEDSLAHGLSLVAADVADSATTQAVAQEIRAPYDLLTHFLEVLPFVQDWESASVFDKVEERIAYTYERIAPQPGTAKWGWRLACQSPVADDGLPRLESAVPSLQNHCGRWFMWWTNELWSPAFIPELNDQESSRFKRYAICFEFPKACSIPPSKAARERIAEVYLRQQLSLMASLLQKVRARRAALRSAVSAIMGRNMSHNIGSHVLARYSSEIAGEAASSGGRPDHRSEFLAYLQRRMDFLAEIATTDQAFWSQALSLTAQLDRLNWESSVRRTGGREPILLTYIAGKGNLKATVAKPCTVVTSARFKTEVDSRSDVLFACPGGEVGVHALFIILENIIRNSARHSGAKTEGTFEIKVQVDDSASTEDEICVRIVDTRTSLNEQGFRLNVELEAVPGMLGSNPKQENRLSVTDTINGTLRLDVPFLRSNGAPDQRNWGVREIQTCAHYLLNIPLSDMESNVGIRTGAPRKSREVVVAAPRGLAENGDCCLEYRIWLMRPRLLAVVVNSDSSLASSSRCGVKIIKVSSEEHSTDAWSDAVGFNFMVVASGIEVPKLLRWVLPVRTLRDWSPEQIDTLVGEATAQGGESLGWMEQLHEHVARRAFLDASHPWFGRDLVAFALLRQGRGEALRSTLALGSGPIRVATQPNPPESLLAQPFPMASRPQIQPVLDGSAIGLCWADHLTADEFGLRKINGFENKSSGWALVEAAYSGAVHTEFLNGMQSQSRHWEILAAGVQRIAIIDERVQAERGRTVRTRRLEDWWRGMGLWNPSDKECDLAIPNIEEFRTFLNSASGVRFDFLVIHLTLLEAIRDARNYPSIDEVFHDLVSGTPAQSAERVIVTGRGLQLHELAAAEGSMAGRYMPISTLLEYMTIRPSKLGLMRALWSAATPNSKLLRT